MATIENEYENAFIADNIRGVPDNYWIGLIRSSAGGLKITCLRDMQILLHIFAYAWFKQLMALFGWTDRMGNTGTGPQESQTDQALRIVLRYFRKNMPVNGTTSDVKATIIHTIDTSAKPGKVNKFNAPDPPPHLYTTPP